MSDERTIEDGFGSVWGPCEFETEHRGRCGFEVVRPGKVQCGLGQWCPNDLRSEVHGLLIGLHVIGELDEGRRRYYRTYFGIDVPEDL